MPTQLIFTLDNDALNRSLRTHMRQTDARLNEILNGIRNHYQALIVPVINLDNYNLYNYNLDNHQAYLQFLEQTGIQAAPNPSNDWINTVIERYQFTQVDYRQVLRDLYRFHRETPPAEAPRSNQDFNLHRENTHDRSVTLTAHGSLERLAKFYPHVNVNQCITELEIFLNTFDYNSPNTYQGYDSETKKGMVLNFWALTKNRFDTVHTYSGLSTKEVVALVWTAVNDGSDEALTEDLRQSVRNHTSQNSQYIVTHRRESVIQHFIDAYQARRGEGYGNDDICVGGAIHQILAILNKAHSQVVISTGDLAVKTDANAMAEHTVRAVFSSKPPSEQRQMMRMLMEDEPLSIEAGQFRFQLMMQVDQVLQQAFKTLLGLRERDEILSNLTSITIDIKLQNIIDEICQLPNDTENPARDEAILWLKHRADQAYRDADTSFTDEADALRGMLTELQKIDDMMRKVERVEFNYTNNYSANTSRLNAISYMKAAVNQAYYGYTGKGNSVNFIKLERSLFEIRSEISKDHAGFFGKWKSKVHESHLVVCFDKEFSPK